MLVVRPQRRVRFVDVTILATVAALSELSSSSFSANFWRYFLLR